MSLFDTVKEDDILEELKSPGSWFHDTDRRIEYALPDADEAEQSLAE